MKRRNLIAIIALAAAGAASLIAFGSCSQYRIETIQPDEWAILVPVDGDTTQQAKDNSYVMYKDSLVSGKTITIPYKWINVGFGRSRKVLAYNLYRTKRTPITRNWYSTVGSDAGGNVVYTQKGDKAGFATESAGSTGLMIGFSITYNVKAPEKYLFWKGTDPDLVSFGDNTIYTTLGALVNETVANYKDEEITSHKSEITKTLKDKLNGKYLTEYGVEITELGIVGGIQFDNPEIQKQIDNRMIQKMAAEAAKDQLAAFQAKQQLVNYEQTWIDIDMKKALIKYINAAAEKGYTVFPQVVGASSTVDVSRYLK
jgi:hypothetical protein